MNWVWKTTLLAVALVLCVAMVSCSSQIVATGGNPWDMSIRSGVVSHHYGRY
jgi:hypothetical protein